MPVDMPGEQPPRVACAMYAVAAAEQRHVLPLPRPGPYRPSAPQAQPVGVRHAVARAFVGDPWPASLCGADIHAWCVFAAIPFDSGHAAACQRCAQLVAAATSTAEHTRLQSVSSEGRPVR
jgi:hypothetical protein